MVGWGVILDAGLVTVVGGSLTLEDSEDVEDDPVVDSPEVALVPFATVQLKLLEFTPPLPLVVRVALPVGNSSIMNSEPSLATKV